MRILFITAHFPLSDNKSKQESDAFFGGVERFVYETAKRLAKKHDVSILATKVSDEKDYEEVEGLKVYRVPAWFRFFRAPFSPGILGKIKSIDSDVNIVTATYPMFSDTAVLASRIYGRKTILNYHFDGVAYGRLGRFCTWLYYKTFARFMSYADEFTATSEDYAKTSAFLKGKRVFAVPNGVDTDFFTPGGRKEKKKILFVGRLVEYKGLKYLIEAMKKVVLDIPRAKLVIVGDGPLEQELKKQVNDSGLGGNVIFLGHAPKKQLLKEFQSSEIFVLPSINENEAFGITTLEAMACGLPVVATNLPGVRKVANCGVIVEPENSNQLAKAILMLLKDGKMRKNMAKDGLKTVQEKYSWKKVTGILEKQVTA